MVKAASPVRLDEELMQSAALAGSRHRRSAAQQIEYWASLGREVAALVDPDRLLEVKAGLARLQVERVQAPPVAADLVFAAVDTDRRSGALAAAVASAAVRYQACREKPGLLEQIGSADRHQLTLINFSSFGLIARVLMIHLCSLSPARKPRSDRFGLRKIPWLANGSQHLLFQRLQRGTHG